MAVVDREARVARVEREIHTRRQEVATTIERHRDRVGRSLIDNWPAWDRNAAKALAEAEEELAVIDAAIERLPQRKAEIHAAATASATERLEEREREHQQYKGVLNELLRRVAAELPEHKSECHNSTLLHQAYARARAIRADAVERGLPDGPLMKRLDVAITQRVGAVPPEEAAS